MIHIMVIKIRIIRKNRTNILVNYCFYILIEFINIFYQYIYIRRDVLYLFYVIILLIYKIQIHFMILKNNNDKIKNVMKMKFIYIKKMRK